MPEKKMKNIKRELIEQKTESGRRKTNEPRRSGK